MPRSGTATIEKARILGLQPEEQVNGRRPTVTTVERRLGIPHATFHRHYSDLIDEHFRPRIPAPAQPAPGEKTSGHTEANLRWLRQENTDLRRSLELYEEAIRQLALENDALRQGAAVLLLPGHAR
ncbi:hypothetical protein OK006_3036 [Actinobacteria bacterium OK006]|nr:hypothetical protein OK006_3036 [Actinobacteria bacterium OK006]